MIVGTCLVMRRLTCLVNAQVGGLAPDKKLAHALLGIVAVIMRELCR
jgi:hypothetical protein